MENTITISAANQALQLIAYKSREITDRENLQGVHFNSKHVIATDGHKMVIAKKAENEPSNTTIRFNSHKQAPTMMIGAEGYSELGATLVGSNVKNTAHAIEGEFPDYREVLRLGTGYDVTIAFNAEYLLQLAQALNHGSESKNQFVTLSIKLDENTTTSAIVVTGYRDDACGILMPAKTGEHSPIAQLEKILA